ncbi:MAG TPA: hypothetical protein VHN55_01450 [Sphingomicrobium sp.]|nr:hypothetical protein [Sphingomicrobium sp.]
MLDKISGLARALYILLAIVAGFMVLGSLNTALVLVALGLVSGIGMAKENYVPAAATAIALPIIGAALGTIPMVGAQLTAVAANLQLGVAGALASALAIALYHFVMDGVTGMAGGGATAEVKAAPAR